MNKRKFIAAVASLSILCMTAIGTEAVWAKNDGEEKFNPQPVNSEWKQKDMKGTYAYFVNGKEVLSVIG